MAIVPDAPPTPTALAALPHLLAYVQALGLEPHLDRPKRGVPTLALALVWLALAWLGSGRPHHIAQLADHRARAVTTPNNDTFYSSAWLDLSIEPMFLTVPPVGHLYYSYAFMDLFTNDFAYVSHRLHVGEPPTHMIVGPSWTGDPPSDVKLLRAPTHLS